MNHDIELYKLIYSLLTSGLNSSAYGKICCWSLKLGDWRPQRWKSIQSPLRTTIQLCAYITCPMQLSPRDLSSYWHRTTWMRCLISSTWTTWGLVRLPQQQPCMRLAGTVGNSISAGMAVMFTLLCRRATVLMSSWLWPYTGWQKPCQWLWRHCYLWYWCLGLTSWAPSSFAPTTSRLAGRSSLSESVLLT